MHKNRLRILREEKNLTQSAVAAALNMSRATLSNYESGLTPSIDNAIALAQYYMVSLDYILGLSDERRTNVGSLASEFVTLSQLSDGNAPTASDLMALLDAAIVYLRNGKLCGNEPLIAWRDFMRNLTLCLSEASSGSISQMVDHANAAVIAALDITKMPTILLENNKEAYDHA